jgi:hypothetical protein
MLVTAPCINCLIVGLLLAITFAALRHDKKHSLENAARKLPSKRSCLLTFWAVLFLFNLGGVLRDLPSLWSPVPYTGQSSIQIFFSPSCRACNELIKQADRLPHARWFPVPEDERDIWVIQAMTEQLIQGVSLEKAVEYAQTSVPALPEFSTKKEFQIRLLRPDMLILQFRLWKNRAHVLASGSDHIPFVEFMGLPSFFMHNVDDTHPDNKSPLSDIPELNVAGFCSGENATPCESPENTSRPVIDTSGLLP